MNSELRFRYYLSALEDVWAPENKWLASVAAKWVVGEIAPNKLQGRMKFCRSVLASAFRVNAAATREAFLRHKMEFHPIARKLISKV